MQQPTMACAALCKLPSLGWKRQQQRRWRGQQQRRQQTCWLTAVPCSSRLGCKVLAGMHVPSESFGGVSPERRAAQSLQVFFTFIAARIVMSQLEGIGRGDLGSYNAEASNVLRHFLQNEPMKDANEWLSRLMQQNEMLGVRIMEVRAAYAKSDFEWNNMQRLAVEGLETENTRLLRQHARQRFMPMLDAAAGSEDGQ